MSFTSRPGGGGGLSTPGGGGVPADINIAQVNGSAAGMSATGRLGVIGSTADAAAYDNSNPVLGGLVIDEVLEALVEGEVSKLLGDLYGRLHVRGAGYSDVLDAMKVSALNTMADDRDPSAQTWVDLEDIGVGPIYYPTAAGREVGNRTRIHFQFYLKNMDVTWEESDDGTGWVSFYGYNREGDARVNTIGEGVGTDTYRSIELNSPARYVRLVATRSDADNRMQAIAITRVAVNSDNAAS